MKKSYSIILIGILILSGYSTIANSNNGFNREKININFSNIQIREARQKKRQLCSGRQSGILIYII